jgi:hypothetical protein
MQQKIKTWLIHRDEAAYLYDLNNLS